MRCWTLTRQLLPGRCNTTTLQPANVLKPLLISKHLKLAGCWSMHGHAVLLSLQLVASLKLDAPAAAGRTSSPATCAPAAPRPACDPSSALVV